MRNALGYGILCDVPTIEDYKKCQARTPGHRWDPYAGTDWKPLFGRGVEWMCGRCDSVKRWTIDSNGKVYTQYVPSPGYRWWLDRGEPKPTLGELRLDVLADTLRALQQPPAQRARRVARS